MTKLINKKVGGGNLGSKYNWYIIISNWYIIMGIVLFITIIGSVIYIAVSKSKKKKEDFYSKNNKEKFNTLSPTNIGVIIGIIFFIIIILAFFASIHYKNYYI